MEENLSKRHRRILLFIGVAVFLLAGMMLNHRQKTEEEAPSIKIGVSLYKTNDTFIGDIMEHFENAAKAYEKETGIKVNLDITSAKENQRIQNDQIKRYIALNYDVLCVNVVDRTNAAIIIDAAMEKDIPIVFFNREPVYEDIFRWDKIFYVGTNAIETAVLQGEILADAIEATPAIDKNGDGKIQYVILEGEMGHQDAIIRTEWSVQTLAARGIELEQLESAVANWERSQAMALMDQWISIHGENIEAVLCNNDDMAMGAADALERAGITDIPVLGIDATTVGIAAVEQGRLLGTIDCNPKDQGTTIFRLAASLAVDNRVPEDLELEDERYIKVELKKITS